MENTIRQELEKQQKSLTPNNKNSWWIFTGSTLEDKYRQQCVKELERVLISRQQLDRTTKNNYMVGSEYEDIHRLLIVGYK